jgi:hypothetical protein
VFAQSDRGTITGTVSDLSGAVVPRANVTAVYTESGTEVPVATTETGNYTIASLRPGIYNLTVEAAGFKKATRTGIQVAVASNVRIDVTLEVGSASESVTVTAEAALLQTEDATQSHTLTGQQMGNLPINFGVLQGGYIRSPLSFVTMEPGANNSGLSTIRVNGMPNNTTGMYVEGQESGNVMNPGSIYEQTPGVDAIEAVALQTSNFSPEFGQIVAGIFNFNTKSGTNSLHATAYEYFVNEDFNAGLTFSDSGHGHLIRPMQRKNDFGFSVGAPIYIPHIYNGKNKSFFFYSWEWYKDHRNISGIYQTVPTNKMRAGDFSEILTGKTLGTDPLGRSIVENAVFDPLSARAVNGQSITDMFPGNIIPTTRLSPVALKIQNYIPVPTNGSLVSNWNQTYTNPKFISLPSIKLDQNLGDKHHISFFFSGNRIDSFVNPDGLPVPITGIRPEYERNHTIRLNEDYTILPTLIGHVGVGYSMYRSPDDADHGVLQFDAPGKLGLYGGIPNNYVDPSVYATGFPRMTGTSTGGYGMTLGMGPTNANKYATDKITTVFNLSWVKGNHSYKFGVNWRKDFYRDRHVNGTQGIWGFDNTLTAQPYLGAASLSGGNLGSGYADFLLGLASSGSIMTVQDPQYRKTSLSLFVQDTWKVSRKLTLSYGIRWDRQNPFREIHDRFSVLSLTTPNPSAGGLPGAVMWAGNGEGRCNCWFLSTYPYAFQPRLGLAYQLDSKTVLRAAWGLSYGNTQNANYFEASFPIVGGAQMGFNNLSFSSSGFGQVVADFAKGLPYTQAQMYPTKLDPGIFPFPGQLNLQGPWLNPDGGRPPRINQWNVGVQRQLTQTLMIEAAYVGNRGVWLASNGLVDVNALTVQKLNSVGLSLNNASDLSLLTSTFASGKPQAAGFKVPYANWPVASSLAQALRPFPQFGTISAQDVNMGNSYYDSLQAKATLRPWHGLYFQYAGTWQKEIDQIGASVNDVFNRQNQKAISVNALPLVSAVMFNYQMPAITSNKVLRAIQKDWTIGGSMRYQSGALIAVPLATNNLTAPLPRAAGTRVNRVPGVPLFTQSPDCHCFDPAQTFILNPAAWTQPAAGQWGTSAPYYNDYRWQRMPSESASLGRMFRIREKVTFSFRAEFFNIFNRVFLNAPTSTNSSQTQVLSGKSTVSGFGYINTLITPIQAAGGATPTMRNGQLVARIQF